MNLPSDVYSDCLHSLVNGHTVFWSVDGLLVISMRTSHRGLNVSKRKRWAGKSRMVLVNSPAKAMLGGRRQRCPAVCTFCAKDMITVRFGLEVQMADKKGQTKVDFGRSSDVVHSAQAKMLNPVTHVFQIFKLA